MALHIPENGLSLWRGDQPGHASPDPHSKPDQIMRLNLAQNTIDELVDSLRKDQKARLKLGKHQTLYYGNGAKSQPFHAFLQHHRSELYTANTSDRENMYFSGVLSHSIEVQKAKEDTAGSDEALATLEQSMSALERGKESRKTQLVNLTSDGRRSHTKGLSRTDLEKERFFNNRSLPNSPSLGGLRSPASVPALTPTSAPPSQNKRKIRLDALKVPFMHLLAAKSLTTKEIAQKTRCSQDDCQELVNKHAVIDKKDPSTKPNELPKYTLKDKSYAQLDIWKFPYPNESDRSSAIERAISAFDRQRFSTSDKVWQLLNNKEEKAKAICKSKLKLQTGPQPPQIKVHASEETAKESGKDETMTGNETDRTNGRLTPTGPVSTKTTQPKKKSAPAKSNNSTLTGRVTKRTDKKAPAKPDGKFKSAEFVHDSDEDLDMADAPAPAPAPAPSPPPSKKQPAETSKPASKLKTDTKPTATKPAATKTPTATRSPAAKPQVTIEPRPRNLKKIPANSNGTSSKARQTKPTSPTKPSPLASSPPTNASDIDNSTQNSGQTSSSSSSPLMTQVSRQPKPKPTTTTTTTTTNKPKEAARPNGVTKPVTNALKRKTLAEPTPGGHMNGDDVKRRRPLHSPSGTSSGSASPPLNRDSLRQQLRQKSVEFKKLYSRYRTLHDSLVKQTDPTPSDLTRLKQLHNRVLQMKKDIWEEDRRLQ